MRIAATSVDILHFVQDKPEDTDSSCKVVHILVRIVKKSDLSPFFTRNKFAD